MQFIKKSIIALIILLGFVTFVQAETSWITKKKDKKDKVEQIKNEEKNSTTWIKKKEKNIENFEKQKKENKSWLTKKSKEENMSAKSKLDIYIDIEKLPKAEFYFAAESSNGELFYGYINTSENSSLIKINDNNYYEFSNGFAYSSDGKTVCMVISQLALVFGNVGGKVEVECKNKLNFNGIYVQQQGEGYGTGQSNKGDTISFKFFNSDNRLDDMQIAYNNFSKKRINIVTGPKTNFDVNPTGKYYALLIGNSNYVNWASLSSPENDVTEIAKILNSNYDFEKVITIINGTEKQIMKAFKKLSNLTSDRDYVLIYYSGHGDIKGNNSYWVPIDGEKEYGLGDWINISDIQNYIREEIPNHHIVLMSDSCYFAMETKGNEIKIDKRSQNFQKLLDRRTVMIVQSGSNEPVADVYQDKHSMFGKSFILSLKNNKNIIRMHEIIDNIQIAHSGMQQMPHGFVIPAWGHGGGDFLFIKNN